MSATAAAAVELATYYAETGLLLAGDPRDLTRLEREAIRLALKRSRKG